MAKSLSSSLFLTIIALLGIGLVQVYSSSYIFAIESYGDGLFFFKRQLAFCLLSFFVLIATIHIPLHWVRRFGWLAWIMASLLVVATFIPGFGVRVGGALRWVQLPGGVRFEPSELLKFVFSLWFASLLIRKETILAKVKWPVLVFVTIAPVFILLKQPDFGSFSIITLVALCLLFIFGLSWKYIVGAFAFLTPVFYFLVMHSPYRKARILAFLDPWSDPGQKGFQVIQSMLSFQSGGLFGSGLGQGQGKLFFLPEAHTDFTLAVWGEEMGFIGFLVLLALYAFVIFKGIQIGTRCEDPFKRSMSLGLVLTFALSVFINSGVVMGLLPTKGLTLPFLSYGGSSLVVLCFVFGLLLNVEKSLESVDKENHKFGVNKWR